MFDIGWTELLLIGIVALIVVGPKELPGMFRKMGQITGKARAMARDFQRAMDTAADEAGVKDIQRDFRKMTSAKSLGMDEVENSIKSGLSASDFTKDWQGNPIDPDPSENAATDKAAPAKPASRAIAHKAAPKSAAKKVKAAGTSQKPVAKTAAKSASKARAKTGGKGA
jgi:sec-independent protein translocase protein TatB